MKLSYIVYNLFKEYCHYGYKIYKSTKSSSYYLKSERNLTIRISDHHLYPNQEREKTIDVIFSEQEMTVNGKHVTCLIQKAKYISRAYIERIYLELRLYKK